MTIDSKTLDELDALHAAATPGPWRVETVPTSIGCCHTIRGGSVKLERVLFTDITLAEANEALEAWGHKMGPLHRGNQSAICHGLFHGSQLVAVTTVSTLITPQIMGGALKRDEACELSRLCASRPGLCRVALRLWREFVFPTLPYRAAISYQDADIHNGNTYRFDGWKRAAYSHSGTDRRSGRPGRNKWIWIWPASVVHSTGTVGQQES